MDHDQIQKRFSWPLFLSPFISRLGDALYIFGLNWFIVKATGEASMLGVVQGIGGIVLMVGDVLAGPLVDNFNRKWIMIISDLLSVVASGALAIVINAKNPAFYQLVLLTIILDIGWAFNFPAAKAIIPEMIKPSSMERFNAFANTAFNLANVIAPLIGGFLLTFSWIDFKTFLWINAGSFFLSLIFSLILDYHPTIKEHKKLNVFESLIEGFKYIWKKSQIMQLVLLDCLLNIFYAGVNLLLPYEIDHYYQGNEKYYSYVLALMAVGGLIGGLSLAHNNQELNIRQIYRELAILGVVVLINGLIISYPVLLVVTAIFGFYFARVGVRMMTIVQNLTAIEYLGRVFAIWFLSVDSMQPLGNFIFGFVIDRFKHSTFLILGTVLLIGLLLVFIWARRRKAQISE